MTSINFVPLKTLSSGFYFDSFFSLQLTSPPLLHAAVHEGRIRQTRITLYYFVTQCVTHRHTQRDN